MRKKISTSSKLSLFMMMAVWIISPSWARDVDKAASEHQIQKPSADSIIVIPTGTKLVVVLQTSIDGVTAKPGDKISLVVSRVLPDDTKTLAGCEIEGEIYQNVEQLNINNQVLLKTNSLVMPGGIYVPIDCQVLRHGGVASIKRADAVVLYDSFPSMCPFQSPYPPGVWPLYGKKNKYVSLLVGDQLTLELVNDLRLPGSAAVPASR